MRVHVTHQARSRQCQCVAGRRTANESDR